MYKNKSPYNLVKNILETVAKDEVPFISLPTPNPPSPPLQQQNIS